MADIKKKYPVINYTSREFNTIRNDLIEHAKRYYPDTYRDFNEASFGSLMVDMVAYVGDILSFYVDYQANESFLTNAIEYDNVIKHARQVGYKYNASAAASGLATFFIKCPANTNGMGPDTQYLPVLQKGTTISSNSGATFVLVENLDFSASENEVVVSDTDANNTPTYYAVKAKGLVVSGRTVSETHDVGDFEKFKTLELGSANITEIYSVYDLQGHQYYEVENLSQNVIYTDVQNQSDDKLQTPSLMIPVVVPRRFTTETIGQKTLIQFGYGSDSELSSSPVADPSDVLMDIHGKDYVSDRGFDPNKLMSSDKFGVVPTNTTLTIIFRVNDSDTVNASSDTITGITSPFFVYQDRQTLVASKVSVVESSLEVTNEQPIYGSSGSPTIQEIKHRAKAHYATQNRAVTKQDYKSYVYAMPGKFGSVKRCNIIQDPDSFRRNLNFYVTSQAPNGNLIKTPESTKRNLKTWLGKNKMINDSIDVLDAKIANISIEFKVIAMPTAEGSKFSLLRTCIDRLAERMFGRYFEIGEPLDISQIYKTLNLVPGVMDTVDVKVSSVSGGIYSSVPLNTDLFMSADGRKLYVPDDHILELKYPNTDITGVVE
tara:strand:+ start:2236 stop:4044 length:1809 start_codon:yes stop_codon:yes gene_type:complete